MTLSAVEIACSSCGAQLVVPPGQRTARCPYCDSPSVVDRPASTDRPDPVFAIGFAVDRKRALEHLRGHLQARRWAPKALRRGAAERVEGVYLPAYLYSAVASSRYHAEIGENYVVTEVDPKKKTTRRVTKTEFRSLDGPHRCYVEDLVVTASEGIPNAELEAVEPFDLDGLRRYHPSLVSGWTAEEPSLTRDASLELARGEARAAIGRRLAAFMPGDSQRGLRSDTELDNEAMDLTLLPVWVCAVRWRPDRDPVRLLVNGQTGKVAGKVPVSWAKVAAVVVAAAAVVALGILIGALL